jgi:hypothetical protein
LVKTNNTDALIAVSDGPNLWRTIFTDDNCCHIPPNWKNNSTSKACKATKCQAYKLQAVQAAIHFFIWLNDENKRPHPYYTESSELAAAGRGNIGDQVSLYFRDPNDAANQINCTSVRVPAPAQPFDPTKDPVFSNVRVRGSSDDLNFDRSQSGFKGTTPATASFTADSSAAHTYTTKVNGAVGYAFDTIPQTQIVPYVSSYQSITRVSPRTPTLDPNNNVAGGILIQYYLDYGGFPHVFSAKPQYLYDTTNHAELGSLRAIYAPWVDIPFMNITNQSLI